VKRILVGWLSGSWTQKCWDRFGWWPLRLGGEITLAEGLHYWGRRAVPLLNYTLVFALQLRKSTENLGQGRRVVGDYSLRRIGRIFRDNLGWPAEHHSTSITRRWLQSALGRHKCLPSCRTKGFPTSTNFVSKLSVSALMWSAKNGIPKFSWICLLLNVPRSGTGRLKSERATCDSLARLTSYNIAVNSSCFGILPVTWRYQRHFAVLCC
jgi:hypothetical protein